MSCPVVAADIPEAIEYVCMYAVIGRQWFRGTLPFNSSSCLVFLIVVPLLVCSVIGFNVAASVHQQPSL